MVIPKMAALRFSIPVTMLIGGLLGLAEETIALYPWLIPIDPLRYFTVGAIPLLIAFLYKEEGVPAPAPTSSTPSA